MKSLVNYKLHFSFSYTNNAASLNIKSDSLLLPLPLLPANDWYYAEQKNNFTQIAGNLNLSFRYKINNRYFFRTALNVATTQQQYTSDLYQNPPQLPPAEFTADSLRNKMDYGMNDYAISFLFIKNNGVIRFKIGGIGHAYSYNALPINNKENLIYRMLPQAEFSIFFSEQHSLTLSYSEQDNPTLVSQFAQGTRIDGFKSYSSHSAMDYLYATKQSVALSYMLFKLFSKTTLNVTGSYNSVKDDATVNYLPNGLQTESQIIDSRQKENFQLLLLFDQGLGSLPWTARVQAFAYNMKYYTQTMGDDNKNNLFNSNTKILLASNYRKIINVEAGVGIEYLQTNSSLNPSQSYQLTQRYNGKLNITIAKLFRANVSLEYARTNSADFCRNFYYLNAAAYYRFWKSKIEIGVEGINMLNINKQEWISVVSSSLYTAEMHLYQLPGNIMLRLNYRF